MIINGREIALSIQEELKEDIQRSEKSLKLGIFSAIHDLPDDKRFAIEKFMNIKQRFADAIGVELIQESLGSTTEEALAVLKEKQGLYDGVVVQLPLPSGMNSDAVRNAIDLVKDVDVLSFEANEAFMKGELATRPPVVGSIAEIIARNNISVEGKRALVIGRGRLVGLPVKSWLEQQGAMVTMIGKEDILTDYTHDADIIVLGAGSPGLLTKDTVKEGVIVFDAGTSEEGGKLSGDADPAVSEKAAFFTPVPGGIGPITVAVLFKNLLILSGLHR